MERVTSPDALVVPLRAAAMPAAITSTPPAVGVTIDNRYELAALLGEGTFGDVWRASDHRLAGRPVAVKFLKAEYIESSGAIARFDAEGAALAQVPHPNIVGVLDRGVWNHQRYIVMEFVEGRSLAAWIDEHRTAGKLPDLATALSLFDQLCAGIEAAHAVRSPGPIVHRDLKPENVLVRTLPSGDAGVKILDFGIAQLGRRSGTRSGALMGTPLYMAPEQAMGQVATIGPWTDVFALGVVLVEMLTGRQQANADEPWWGTALQRPAEVRGALGSLRADVPAALWDVIARCLRPTGQERYAHAGELRAALRQVTVNEGLSGVSVPPRASATASSPADARAALGRTPTELDAARPPSSPRGRAPDAPPETDDVPWGRLVAMVAAGAVLLALGILAAVVAFDRRSAAAGGDGGAHVAAHHAQRPIARSSVDDATVQRFLDRWLRARSGDPGAETLDRLYASALKYHGSARIPDYAAMARDLDRIRQAGGTFEVVRNRTDWSPEAPEADPVPSACRQMAGATGAVVKVRAWVRETRPDRGADIGCPTLEGRYLLRMRDTPDGLRICHETWSVDEGICASCPTAPLCLRRRDNAS